MPLIDVKNLYFSYAPRAARETGAWTLSDLSFSVEAGGFLGIVGESGSGKSTLIRNLCGLLPVTNGDVQIAGRNLAALNSHEMLELCRDIQLIYQNPKRSFDPRMKIGMSISQPIRSLEKRVPSDEELTSLLARVGLQAEHLNRFPHELSGGQLQRVAIARALSVKPSILLADEPTSALDVSVQAQALKLIAELREQLNLTVVLVSHDLAVVGRVTDSIIVLKDGVIVEAGNTANVLLHPRHAYTQKLAEAAAIVSL
ncbi:MAG: ABC transporter ATP-binding protein [Pseudomonadales bacterium]